MKISSIRNFNFLKLSKREVKDASYRVPYETKNNFQNNNTSNPFFTGFACSTEAFMPRKLYEIPCASCGGVTLQPKQIEGFVRTVQDLRGEELVQQLQRRNNLYREFEAGIVEKICATAVEYPDYDLNAIVNNLSQKYVDELKSAQLGVFNKIRSVAKKLKRDDEAKIEEYLKKQENLITKPDYEQGEYFRRLDFMNGLITAGKDIKQSQVFKQILVLADQIPSSSNSESAFYVSYSRKQNDEIARRIISPSASTTEHMLPASKGGKNESSNYIVMCSSCNSKRSNMSYTEWIKTMPNMVKNFNNYLVEVTRRIDDGELGLEYVDYPKEAHDTFEVQLGRKIEPLVVTPSVEVAEVEENSEVGEEFLDDRIEFLDNLYKEREKELNALKAKAEALLKDPRFALYRELEKNEGVLKSLKLNKKDIDKKKEEAQKRVTSYERRKNRLEELQRELERNEGNAKAQADTREKIKKVTYEPDKHQEAVEKLEALKKKSERQLNLIKQKEEEIISIRAKLKFPEDYAEEERALDSQVQRRKDLRTKIIILKRQLGDFGVAFDKANKTQTRLEEIEEELKALNINENDAMSSLEVKKYQEFEEKLAYIDSHYKTEGKRDSRESSILISIFEEAKENIYAKMEDLAKIDSVKYYILKSEKDGLSKEIETTGDVGAKKGELEKDLAFQEEQLTTLLLAMSDEDLDKQIAQIRAQKAEILEIMKNLDIEDKVASFENQLKSLLDSICKMRKKKHSLEYRKHVLQENLVEALRNIGPENPAETDSED